MPRGAPRGNQNARKHGYYSKAVSRESRAALAEAAFVRGLQEEIALARFLLRDTMMKDPGNRKMLLQTLTILARLSLVHTQTGGSKEERLGEAIRRIWTDVAVPMGVKFLPWSSNEPMPGEKP